MIGSDHLTQGDGLPLSGRTGEATILADCSAAVKDHFTLVQQSATRSVELVLGLGWWWWGGRATLALAVVAPYICFMLPTKQKSRMEIENRKNLVRKRK